MMDWIWGAIGLAVFVLFGVAAVCSYIDGSAKCHKHGGTYYCPRGSECLCLAPGIVIP